MADVRDGLGPLLGVYLQAQDWSPVAIGAMMTVGGLAAVVATTPAGMWADATRRKRLLLMIAAAVIVVAAMAAAAMVATASIDPHRIDPAQARGAASDEAAGAHGWSLLWRSQPLLVLAITLLLFHLGNAAMLPLVGQALAVSGAGDPSASTGATIVVAQLTMVPAALVAARLAQARGYGLIFVLALVALPVRGATAALVGGPAGLVPVQILDGVGAGLLGVAVPGLVARILSGSGHVNAGRGAVMTVQGIGAALSPALGGLVAERYGYAVAFAELGGIALVALTEWIGLRAVTALACAGPGETVAAG